jgi:hypothetical protein
MLSDQGKACQCTAVPGASFSGVVGRCFGCREAYARVTTPETLVKTKREREKFSTGVEKTVENRGFSISQA